jgi:hypothetical protein
MKTGTLLEIAIKKQGRSVKRRTRNTSTAIELRMQGSSLEAMATKKSDECETYRAL